MGRTDPGRSDGLSDDEIRQMQALGVDVSSLAPAPSAPVLIEVWREHWDTLRLFLATSTQWRVAGTFGGVVRTGLDYGEVRAMARDMDVAPVDWPALRVIEIEAMSLLNSGDA